MLSELVALSRIRLERDLSYDALGAELGLTRQTLYRILTTPNARVHDRTLFKIQRFLAKATRPQRAVRAGAAS